MKNLTIADILTPEEMERVQRLWRQLKSRGRFAAVVEQDVIMPNVARIRAALGEDSGAHSLANWIEAVCGEADRVAGRLWELGDDLCQVCGAYLGRRLRFMHQGLCDTCRRAPKH